MASDPVGVEQEMWALLTLYQLLRRTMIEAAESRPGTDPDRCGFAIALQTACDLLVCAEGVFEQGIEEIGRRVLSALSPARRTRVSTRKVKSPISRYTERKLDGRADSSKVVTSMTITLLPPPSPEPALPATTVRENTGNGKTGSRMARVLAILQTEPERLWRAREIAELLGDVTLVATYRQLARWTERGMVKRVRTGRCTAITQTTSPLA
ncbi:hypothetical protein ACFCX0_49440 [Streptomyces sp. NPDC056352]|uniref:hypothetical protein n=1 Tax=Streptomyces sp. NPDC056352 TaxID=3345791 RepID=UPI0035E25190